MACEKDRCGLKAALEVIARIAAVADGVADFGGSLPIRKETVNKSSKVAQSNCAPYFEIELRFRMEFWYNKTYGAIDTAIQRLLGTN